jgi:hypothetical protein
MTFCSRALPGVYIFLFIEKKNAYQIKLSQNQSIRVSTVAVTEVAIYKEFILS